MVLSFYFQFPPFIDSLYMSSSAGLQQAFRPFGSVKVEWPGKEGKQNRHPPKGKYLRMLLEIFYSFIPEGPKYCGEW